MKGSRGTRPRDRSMSLCSWFGCGRQAVHNGYCQPHHNEYMRDWRRATKPVFAITRGELEQALGREVTALEVEQFIEFIRSDLEQQIAAGIEYIRNTEEEA